MLSKNKQCHEIQSAYFGHKAFALFTAACYVKGHTDKALKSMTDKDTGLVVLSVVIISNQTIHERNTAFSCNGMLIDFIRDILPGLLKRCIFGVMAVAANSDHSMSLSFFVTFLQTSKLPGIMVRHTILKGHMMALVAQ